MVSVKNITEYRLNDLDLEPGETKNFDMTPRIQHLMNNKVLELCEPTAQKTEVKTEKEVKTEVSDKADTEVSQTTDTIEEEKNSESNKKKKGKPKKYF